MKEEKKKKALEDKKKAIEKEAEKKVKKIVEKEEKKASEGNKKKTAKGKKKKIAEEKKKGTADEKSKQEEAKGITNYRIKLAAEIIEMALYLLFVCLVVWGVITYVGQRTVVDGVSMYDTLDDGDNLWVSKISYNLGDPERFDIVVFPVDDEGTYYIKRIIGMPGETVRIDEEGTIYINDEPLEESYGYETIRKNRRGRAKEGVTLGKDEYFVMGDNRNESEDSRFELVGNVKRELLVGKAVFRLWPLSSFGKVE